MLGQFAWITAGRVTAAILQALTFGALALLVTPAALGAVGTLLALLLVLQTLCDLGVSTYLVRTRAASPDDGRIRSAVVLNRITTVPLLLVGVVLAVVVSALHDDVSLGMLLPLAVWAAAERNAETVAGIALADGRASFTVFNLVLRRAVMAAGFFLLGWWGVEAILAYGLASALGALLSVLWTNAVTPLPTARVALSTVAREARAYWANSVAVQARNLDVAVVSGVAGAAAAGVYSLASRLVVPLRLVPTSLATAVLPHAARTREHDDRRRVMVNVAWILGAVSVLYVGLALTLPWVVAAFPGLEPVEPAVPATQILLLALPFAASGSVASALLQARGLAGFVSRVAVLMSAVCLVGAGVGGAVSGATGAAAAFAVALTLQAVVLGAKVRTVTREDVSQLHPVPDV
ncbi:oligosaccharide flippase family protein [Cellulosimicrobium terreum]|nr:oligosaccharide flippase family protein [Cellulosimicrobium terreum]